MPLIRLNINLNRREIETRAIITAAIVLVFASYIGGLVMRDEMGFDLRQDEVVGPVTGFELVAGSILLGVGVITIWFLFDGIRAVLSGIRILVRSPVTAAEAHLQDEIIEF